VTALYGADIDSASYAIPLKSPIRKATKAKAAWAVLGLAEDAEEAAEVLEALGLTKSDAMAGKLIARLKR
jgi:hypothetical protein